MNPKTLPRLEAELNDARKAYNSNPTQFTRSAMQTAAARLEFWETIYNTTQTPTP